MISAMNMATMRISSGSTARSSVIAGATTKTKATASNMINKMSSSKNKVTTSGKILNPRARGNTSNGEKYAQTLPGIIAPTGFLDPFNLSQSVTPAEVKRWREAELTHGRVSMLAFVGYLVGELPSVEQNPLFNGAVTGPALTQFQQVEAQSGYFWELLLLAISIAEVYRALKGWNPPVGDKANLLRDDYTPGDLGFDPLGMLKDKSDEEILDMKNKELSHGRLAMYAISGLVAQELVDGQKIFDHLQNMF